MNFAPHQDCETEQICFENLSYKHQASTFSSNTKWLSFKLLDCHHDVADKRCLTSVWTLGEKMLSQLKTIHWWLLAVQIVFPNYCGSLREKDKATEGILPVPDNVVPSATEGCCSAACHWETLDQSQKKEEPWPSLSKTSGGPHMAMKLRS